MGCGCNGASQNASNGGYEVRLPNGEVRIVETEHDARIAITMAGGGEYKKR